MIVRREDELDRFREPDPEEPDPEEEFLGRMEDWERYQQDDAPRGGCRFRKEKGRWSC